MRLAVLSDIHGNLTALEVALADLEAQGEVDHIWILGDLAAFGPRPVECIQKVFTLRETLGKEKVHIIGGNTDRYLVNGTRPYSATVKEAEAFAKVAESWQVRDTALNWAVRQLSFDDYEKLAGILGHETELNVPGYGYVIGYHGTPGDDEGFLKPDTASEEALDSLLDREGRLGIGGHIHVQMDRDLGRWRAINVGSVGLSFDAPGKVQWGLFTFKDGDVTIDLRQLDYDVDAVIADLNTVAHPAPGVFTRFVRPNS